MIPMCFDHDMFRVSDPAKQQLKVRALSLPTSTTIISTQLYLINRDALLQGQLIIINITVY